MIDNDRIDKVLFELGLTPSRSKAQELIKSGGVMVNGKIISKPNQIINFDDEIEIINDPCPWVSRAGLKLAGATSEFKINVSDKVCLDIGASTGGFCDVLLSLGASEIYAVDVGHSQIHEKIANDERVIVMEGTDARELDENIIPPIDIMVCDVSFVSVLKIIDKPLSLLKPNAEFLILIKPQFEVGKSGIGKGGIVKDQSLVDNAIQTIKTFFVNKTCDVISIAPSTIKGSDGNQEYVLYGIKK